MNFIRSDRYLIVLWVTLSVIFHGACSDVGDSARIEDNSPLVGHCGDVLILTAMPAELAPLLDNVEVIETFQLGKRVLYSAKRGGHRLMLAMTGIGLVNAAQMTTVALENFPVDALLYSGVAGSTHRIGDVVIADQWSLSEGNDARPVDDRLLRAAKAIGHSPLPYQRCTSYPLEPPGERVCLAHEPELILGGTGRSDDPFMGNIFSCIPDGDDVFGCAPANAPDGEPIVLIPHVGSSADTVVAPGAGQVIQVGQTVQVEDMESAMALEVANMFNVPAIAIRGVSDGRGDPLNLNGFPAQFFAYYRLAAENAAMTTLALFDKVVAGCVESH